MKILHILPTVDPRGGGPMEGVRQRGALLNKMGHEVSVASLDDPSATFVRDYGIPVFALGPGSGGYRYSSRLKPWLLANAERYDAIIINGLWQYHAFGAWRVLRRKTVPYFVFPHGMLDPWFKKQYPMKHLKKMLYWLLSEYWILKGAKKVLFTSAEEQIQAEKSFRPYSVRASVVAYGTARPYVDRDLVRAKFLEKWPLARNFRNILFLGRIQEKKGCDLLVAAFASIANQYADVKLLMAGPDQTGWVATLKEQAIKLGIEDRIIWTGMLEGDSKWGAFYSSECFILPSHQENFGISVAEALACGLPVLISDKVNIWREILHDRSGLVAPDTIDGTRVNLTRWLTLQETQRREMVQNALTTFSARFTVQAMAGGLLSAIANGNNLEGEIPEHFQATAMKEPGHERN